MCVWLPAVSPRLSNVRCRGIGLVGYSGSPPGTRAAASASPIGRSNQEISGGAKRRGGSQIEKVPLVQLPPLAGYASRSRCPPMLGGQLVYPHFRLRPTAGALPERNAHLMSLPSRPPSFLSSATVLSIGTGSCATTAFPMATSNGVNPCLDFAFRFT